MKKELESEYQSMLEKNKQEMENMEKQFQERLAEAQSSVSYVTETTPSSMAASRFKYNT